MNSIQVATIIGSLLDPISLLITYLCARYFVLKGYPFLGVASITFILVSIVRETLCEKAIGQLWGDTILFNSAIAAGQAVVVTLILMKIKQNKQKLQ